MKYFENTVRIRLPHTERYSIHQLVDTLVQERAGHKFPYSLLVQPHDTNSILKVRTSTALHLPGEEAKSLNVENGVLVSFQINMNDQKMQNFKFTHRTMVEMESYIQSNGPRFGLDVLSATAMDSEKYTIKKPKSPQFVLGCCTMSVIASVLCKEDFEVRFVEGIGKKRIFGFGFVDNLKVL